jgi:putative hemolysin
MGWQLLTIFLIILANGFFSLAELAILSANKIRLKIMAKRGVRGAHRALRLAEDTEKFIPAVQACISLCAAFAGVFSGATFATRLGSLLDQIPYIAPHGTEIALPLVVIGVSYFSMLLGELVPKHLAINNAERWAARLAPLLVPIVKFLRPMADVLRASTHLVLKILPTQRERHSNVNEEEEVKALVDEGTVGGVFEVAEQQMIKRVLRLADQPVRAIMTARGDVAWLDINASSHDIMKHIHGARHSAYPVCEGSLDQALGVVRAKDLLNIAYSGQALDLRKVMQEAAILPDTATVLSVLEKIKKTEIHMGFVVDEYGGVEGIVTELDILEAIVGELADDEDDAPGAAHEGTVLFDGATAIDEVKTRLHISDLPAEETYHTLGGVALGRLGRIPRVGDAFEHAGWRFEVTEMAGRRVEKVTAVQIKENKLT